MSLYRLIRYRYPNTAIMVLCVLAAVAMLFYGPVRKWGELMLGVLTVAWVTFLAGKPWKRR